MSQNSKTRGGSKRQGNSKKNNGIAAEIKDTDPVVTQPAQEEMTAEQAAAKKAADEQALAEWEKLTVEWLNNPPERTRPTLILPRPPYLDRTGLDRELFMERAKPKITKDSIKDIIRGGDSLMRDVLVSTEGCTIYMPMRLDYSNRFAAGDIEVPIGIDDPSWRPGRDRSGGGGGSGQDRSEDESDIVYMPISYEEFMEALQLLFDLPFLKKTDEDKMLVYSLKMRGLKRSGPMARLEKKATAVARLQRFHASINANPDLYPGLTTDMMPTTEQFPFHKVDLRFKRVEEKWDPDSKAVVFFLFDTSGSMAGEPMAMTKFFFLLVLLWLRWKHGDGIQVVFIAHNAKAERVATEQEFFRVTDGGGTTFAPAYEKTIDIALAEFFGPAWNKYALHGTDGFGEHEDAFIPLIERMVREVGFNLFGMFQPASSWWGGRYKTSGQLGCEGVSADVLPHVGFASASNMDEVIAAVSKIIDKSKSTSTGEG